MKNHFRNLYLFVLVSTGITVIMEPKEHSEDTKENSLNFNDAFGTCLTNKEYGILECANRATLSVIQSFNEQDELNFGNFHLERADGYGRELFEHDYDPNHFHNVIKAAIRLIERRNMKWNLDHLYPGLRMRVGPMINANGILEFVLDDMPSPSYLDKQSGTGRILTRHLLPFLMGFKFNLVSLIPIIFGLLLIVSKKILLLIKVAFLISGLLGWNSIYNTPPVHNPSILYGFNGYDHPYEDGQINSGGHFYDHYHHHHHHPNFQYRPYRVPTASNVEFTPYDRHVVREVIDVYDNVDKTDQSTRTSKNFAWTAKS
ncbi:PREDICTED: uncharacterized protein LOC107064737 [Polistes dominula]|uniref:Uncharacterized protein LOC107064737 n=1 Tax=Polistes dominula TaxID=743375 RepID=A0ABM1HZ46_POLDO|nr:PREDICTED: uncharacterized protein LOC107064737 [Polistes dominula]